MRAGGTGDAGCAAGEVGITGETKRCLDLSVFLSSATLLFSPLLLRPLLLATSCFLCFSPRALGFPPAPVRQKHGAQETPLGPGLFPNRLALTSTSYRGSYSVFSPVVRWRLPCFAAGPAPPAGVSSPSPTPLRAAPRRAGPPPHREPRRG